MNINEKAEYVQSLKAYLIPMSLFISCLIASAGMFLVYSGSNLGWLLIGLGTVVIVLAFVAFFSFQNKIRAKSAPD